MKLKIALFALFVVTLICGCFADDVVDNAAEKRALDRSTIVYQGQFGTIRKIYIENENLTCYVRIDGYEGGLSCFEGTR